MKKILIELISDFNLEPLERLINNANNLKSKKFNYTNIFYQLENNNKSDFKVIWINARNIFNEVNKLHSTKKDYKIKFSKLDAEIDYFCKKLLVLSEKSQIILNSFICFDDDENSNDFLYKNRNSKSFIYNHINNRLVKHFANNNKIYLIDIDKLILEFKDDVFDINYYFVAKSYYALSFYKFYSEFLTTFINNLFNSQKKVIALDLDDTLWGGEIAEIGKEKIILGGTNPEGEAFVEFQKTLLRLKNKGFLLALVSKNEEKVAMDALENHPEMVLKKNDFSALRINWKNKVDNLVEISKELNLGLESFVFFDNSDFERKNAKEHLTQILIPDLSSGPIYYNSILNSLKCFDIRSETTEDKLRAKYYLDNKKRDKYLKQILNKNDWIKNLKIKIKIESYNKLDKFRIIQLLNKTNQMNLKTNRYTELEFDKKLKEKKFNLYSLRVSDKFGDYGLTGIISLIDNNCSFEINDFLMSCRIMGRDIEIMFLKKIASMSKFKSKKLSLKYKKTKKNKPMLDFLNNKDLFKINNQNNYIFINK